MTRVPSPDLATKIEQQLAENGLQVAVESSDGTLVLSGIVESQEARQAALDIAGTVAPDVTLDDQIDVETLLPTDVDSFVSDEPTAVLEGSASDVLAHGGAIDPVITGAPVVTDPVEIVGSDSDGPDDVASTGETYTPPDDPVITTDAHGRTRVLGGFDSSSDDQEVEVSSDGRVGDEALADAVRRELSEDAATTSLSILVAVRNGVAHLRGRVPDLEDADNAEDVASRVPGIREVVEELEVSNI